MKKALGKDQFVNRKSNRSKLKNNKKHQVLNETIWCLSLYHIQMVSSGWQDKKIQVDPQLVINVCLILNFTDVVAVSLNLLAYIRELAAEAEEEDEELVPEGECPSDSTADVDEGSKDEKGERKEEEDDLAEYGLDKYDEEDQGEGMSAQFCVCPSLHSRWPCIMLSFFNLVTANLGDSLAGLTVFSCNEEDPYITIKDTVSTDI